MDSLDQTISVSNQKVIQIFYFLMKCALLLMAVITFNFYFHSHYTSLLIPEQNVIKSLTIINFAILSAIVSLYLFKDIFNPITLYSAFIFFTGYSYITISNKQNIEYSWLTELILFFTIISFLIGCLLNTKVYIIKLKHFSKQVVKILFFLVLFAAIIVFALEIRMLGYVPILNLASGIDVYGETNEALIPFAHYLVLFMALVPAIAYIYYKQNRLGLYVFYFICAIGFFVIVNFLSRQTIMLLMLSLFYAYIFFNKISLTKTIYIGAIIGGMFILIGNLRAGSSELVGGINEFLKAFAGIEKDVSLLETYFTLYASLNFTILDEIVKAAYDDSRIFLGIYLFKPIVSLTFLDRVGLVYYDVQFDGFKRLGTYALEPFLDYHLVGVVLFNLVIGFVCMNTYRSFKNRKNTQSIINWSLLTFCLIMSPFTNFFVSFFIWISFFINLYITNNTISDTDEEVIYL